MRTAPAPRSASRVQALRSRLLALSIAGGVLSSSAVSRAADAAGSASPIADSGEELNNARMQHARRMLLERAKERYDAGRGAGADAARELEGALDAIRLAYQLNPAPWLLFNMAQVQSQLGACGEATALYRAFLASEPGPEARASAEQALHLLGTCNSASDQPHDAALLPGLRSSSALRSLSASSVPLPPPRADEEPAGEAEEARIWPWALAGVAATAGAAATVFYGEARAAQHDLERIRVGGPQVAETRQRGESALALARGFGAVSLGFALAAGACFWWPRPRPVGAPPASGFARLSWLPLEHGAAVAYWLEF